MYKANLSFNEIRKIRNYLFQQSKKLMIQNPELSVFWDEDVARGHGRALGHWSIELWKIIIKN